MNYISPNLCPLHQSHELLSFQSSSNPYCQDQHKIHEDHMLLVSPPNTLGGCIILPTRQNKSSRCRRRRLSLTAEGGTDTADLNKRKKIMHRDVERQRREAMANLYKSLRSLLPHEYLKGKRSIGDHVNEATKYIRNLQNKIQELGEKRDRMKIKLSSASSNNSSTTADQHHHHHPDVERAISFPDHHHLNRVAVTVQQCLVGIEIVISYCELGFGGVGSSVFSLSKVLDQLVHEEGLNVISCVSTKVQQTSFHTILSETLDYVKFTNIDELPVILNLIFKIK
ncbi:Myc-type [Macleaya cordata]|uniref:Myc-type n=1 Tax=Macleaya cordata TaxID=56857 RepID=A0A200QP96_MACCD|nr:Myc-type [Macleaya cordata]